MPTRLPILTITMFGLFSAPAPGEERPLAIPLLPPGVPPEASRPAPVPGALTDGGGIDQRLMHHLTRPESPPGGGASPDLYMGDNCDYAPEPPSV